MRRSRHRPLKWQPRSDFVYVDIQRPQSTTTNESFGEGSNSEWVTIYANMKCHFESRQLVNTGGLPMTEAGLLSESEYLLTCDPKFIVNARDRVVDIDGNAYRVNNARNYATHREVYCDATEIN